MFHTPSSTFVPGVLFAACLAVSASEITLLWNPNPESDIAHYELHYGTEPTNLTGRAEAQIPRRIVSDLNPGQIYFFAVQAHNAAGMVSELSATVMGIAPEEIGSYNLDFEALPDFTGWTATGNLEIVQGGIYSSSANSSRMAAFNTGQNAPNAVLSQDFAVVAGQRYILDFDLGVVAWNTSPQTTRVTVSGNTTLSTRDIEIFGAGGGTPVWFPQTLHFVADREMITLTFRDLSATSANIDMMLDNIHIGGNAAVVILGLQSSQNLVDWATIAELVEPRRAREFLRLSPPTLVGPNVMVEIQDRNSDGIWETHSAVMGAAKSREFFRLKLTYP